MRTISFISANYVARAKNYSGEEKWGVHDRATVESASAEQFRSVAADVAGAGFQNIDIWTAHCHWLHHAASDYREMVKGICSQYDLNITSYAGGINAKSPADLEAPFAFMKQLGAPIFAGGIGGLNENEIPALVNDICAKYGVKWAFENHPQKAVDQILSRIGNGKYKNCGVALDTGWCGTQGLDALEAVKSLRDVLFIVHLKDVKAAGQHDTCALGEGIVPVEAVVRYLVESDWHGNISIEHEPYDRDPMPEVRRSLERLKQWLKG